MKRLKEKREKLIESKIFLKEELYKNNQLEVDEKGFYKKLEAAIEKLEKSPKEKHKDIYSNVIDFIEIHPQKVNWGYLLQLRPKLSL